jgi:hypothetical protein
MGLNFQLPARLEEWSVVVADCARWQIIMVGPRQRWELAPGEVSGGWDRGFGGRPKRCH